MTAQAAVKRGRRAAEALMLDAGTAERPTGETAYDPVTQTEQPVFESVIASTAAKLQARALVGRESEVGGRTAVAVRLELHLPISSAPLAAGDEFEFTAVDDLSSAVVGQRVRVVVPFGKTLATARRYEVEDVVA